VAGGYALIINHTRICIQLFNLKTLECPDGSRMHQKASIS
jgi:hypothetical protein